MKTVQDFNYKVALASGLKHLQAGRLRQAEEQFRYLVSKFPRADGGYRGLARVYVELGDRAAALATLREGAAALSKVGDRTLAIDLLREAVGLDPLDLAVHRRLAAALALAGDVGASAAEYVRFSQAEQSAGDHDRARLEATYALETLGEIPALHELARSLGLGLRTVRAEDRLPEAHAPEPAVDERAALFGASESPPVDERAALFGGPEAAPPVDERAALFGTPPPAQEPEADHRLAMFGATPAWSIPGEEAEPLAPQPWEEPAAPPVAEYRGLDPLDLEEHAAALIASKDPGAGEAAIEAAQALLASGKMNAASDLLLALVSSGTAVHDASRELIGVASALGRRDIATARAELLARVLRLAGEDARAAEVERIGQSV